MIKYVLAAAAALTVAQPAAAAVVFDYNVYSTGNAYISGGSYGAIASGSFTNANGAGGTNYTSRTSSSGSLDQSADAFSLQLAAMAATGSITNSYGAVTLTGGGTGTNVFNLNGSTANWSNINSLTFAGPGTGAIVNVWGTSLTNWVGMNFGSLSANNVIFNFHQATNLSMNGMNVKGSVLAPAAYIQVNGGSIAGSVIADQFRSEGAQVGGAAYRGYSASPQAVPEPATWAMMLLGFGVIGFAMRRRPKPEAEPRIRFA